MKELLGGKGKNGRKIAVEKAYLGEKKLTPKASLLSGAHQPKKRSERKERTVSELG